MTELEEIQRRIELKMQFLKLLEDEKGRIRTELRLLMERERVVKDDQAES